MSERFFNFFKRKKSKPSEPPNASASLAMKIIEKELDLEKTFDLKVIHELISLYTKMIEFYEQNGDTKFYDFQERMHKMLIKPQVISALQKFNCPTPIQTESKTPPPEPDRKTQAERLRKTLSLELSKTLSFSKPVKNAEVIIDRQTLSSRESAHKAYTDFKSQDGALERRLASRRITQVTKSLSFASINECPARALNELSYIEEETSEKSSFFALDEQKEMTETYEKRLEEIMEKNYSERATKIAEIKYKYESQMADINGMGDLQDMILTQMKVNLQDEVNQIVKAFEDQRKKETQKLKDEVS